MNASLTLSAPAATVPTADYRHLQTEVRIDATPEAVWQVLIDFASYPSWNPFVQRIDGRAAVGSTLTVTICPPGQKGMTLRPVVRIYQPNRHFAWLGKLWMGGLFDGEHHFELLPQPDGTTLLRHHEYFRGILIPFLKSMLTGPTRKGFEAMNQVLKARVEGLS